MVKDGRLFSKKDKINRVVSLDNGFILLQNEDGYYRIVAESGQIIVDFEDQVIDYLGFLNGNFCILNKSGIVAIIDSNAKILFSSPNAIKIKKFFNSVNITYSILGHLYNQTNENDGTVGEMVHAKVFLDENGYLVIQTDECVQIIDWKNNKQIQLSVEIEELNDVHFTNNSLTISGTVNGVKKANLVIFNNKVVFAFKGNVNVTELPNDDLVIEYNNFLKNGLILLNSTGEEIIHENCRDIDVTLEEHGIRFKRKNGLEKYVLYDGTLIIDYPDQVKDFSMNNPDLYAARRKYAAHYEVTDKKEVMPERYKKDVNKINFINGKSFIYRSWFYHDVNQPDFCFDSNPIYYDYSVLDEDMNRIICYLDTNPVDDCYYGNGITEISVANQTLYYDKFGKKMDGPYVTYPNGMVVGQEDYLYLVSHPDITEERIAEYNKGLNNKPKKLEL